MILLTNKFLYFVFVFVLFAGYSIQATKFSCNTFARCGCSQNEVDINLRIIGGETVASHSWGWAASLRVENEMHFCGGTILSSEYILTAAHCVDDPEIMDFGFKVAVGTDTLSDQNGQRLPVSEIFVHPHWMSRTNENDIAILKLKNLIDFNDSTVARICIPSINDLANTEFPVINSSLVAIGWGYTIAHGTVSETLQQVTLEAINSNEPKCNNSINNVTMQFCAAVEDGSKDTCEGDSGGPLMFYSEEYRQWMIVGITSYGDGCGQSNHAGVYTRISMYIDWIKSITGVDDIVIAGENSTIIPENTTLTTGGNNANNDIQGTIYSCNTTAPCGCSQNSVVINSRIVGGESAVSHSWGWAVSLRVPNNKHFCGGTILSSHYILTAAHCLDDPNIAKVQITAAIGTDSLYDNNGQRPIVSRIYIHPKWNKQTKENDIAILKLKQAISFKDKKVAKLCLPSLIGYTDTEFPWTNSKLVAIGWGATSFGGDISSTLRQVTVAAVGNKEPKCSILIKNVRVQFCAAVNGGGKDTCQGDSGGPLMYYSYDYDQWMLAGITSYGRGCGASSYAGVYTRVSMYIDWIRSIIGNDGVVIAGENGANISTMSNIFYIAILLFLVLLRSFQEKKFILSMNDYYF